MTTMPGEAKQPPQYPEYVSVPPPHGMPPPQHGMPPPQHGMPPPSYGMPPPSYVMPPPSYGMPPPQHGVQPLPSPMPNYGATTVVMSQPTEIIIVGGCPACRVGVLEDDFTCLGIFCAIFFFPIGILCCLAFKDKRCTNCGANFG